MFEKTLLLGLNHRLITLIVLLSITAVAAIGLQDLRVDTGFSSLISESDPNKAIYDSITAEFGSDNRTIIYVKDAKLWTPEKLSSLEALHLELEKLDFVERIDDLFTLQSIRGNNNVLESRQFLKEAPIEQKVADQARQDALYNPLIVGNIVSANGEATGLLISIRENNDILDFDHQVNARLEQLLQPYHSKFDVLFQVGAPRVNAELKALLFDDMKFLAPASALVLVLAILFFLRSGIAASLPLLTSAMSLIWTFGLMGWFGIPINILTAMLPSLVIVIGSTEDTHMITSYFQGLIHLDEDEHYHLDPDAHCDEDDERKADATRFMMRHMAVPLLLTILTTSLGFASNIFSSIGLIQDFAIASTMAILFNGLITLFFVPMMLSRFGPSHCAVIEKSKQVIRIPGLFVQMFKIANQRFPYRLLIGITLLCIFFVHQASSLHVTNDPMTYFKDSQQLIIDTEEIHQNLSGMKVFYITLESSSEKAFLDPKNIHKLVEIQQFLTTQGIFDRSASLADYLALVNREFHNGDPDYLVVPKKRALVAQYLLFFHRNILESYVSHDYQRANILVRHNISDSDTLNSHVAELREVVKHIAGFGIQSHVVGENLMINAATENLLFAQVKSLLILLFVIFLIMSIMFTSFKGGLIALVPNLIPISVMFGTMALMDISLNPGTAMVAVIAIGIAIDGTIHLFSRYNDLTRKTCDYVEAVNNTVQDEATPMVSTSLALAFGFGILIFSNFTLIAQFGALAAATMLFALFSNLMVTPIIMSRVRLVGLHQILTMSMNKEVLKNSPLFQGMSSYQIKKAILISEHCTHHQGGYLVEQGEVGRSMYLILSGNVEVSLQADGRKQHITSLQSGDVFGEIGYTQETKRTANVCAMNEVEVLKFDYQRLERDLKFFPHIVAKLNFNISRILGQRLAEAVEKMK